MLTIDALLALESVGSIPLAADLTVGKLAARAISAIRSPLERWWYGSRSGSTRAGLLLASLRGEDFRDRERDKRGLSAGPLSIVPETKRPCSNRFRTPTTQTDSKHRYR